MIGLSSVFLGDLYALHELADQLYPGRPISGPAQDQRLWLCKVTGVHVENAELTPYIRAAVRALQPEAERRGIPIGPTLERYL